MNATRKIVQCGQIVKDQENDNFNFYLNIKYYEATVIPYMQKEIQKNRRRPLVSKMELDQALAQVKEWKTAIECNKKFIKLVKQEAKDLKKKQK